MLSRERPALARRTLLSGLATLPLIGGGAALMDVATATTLPVRPLRFDAAAYIADLEAAGILTVMHNGHVFFYPRPGRGFGEGFHKVQAHWAEAIDACPDHVEQIAAIAPVYAPTRGLPS